MIKLLLFLLIIGQLMYLSKESSTFGSKKFSNSGFSDKSANYTLPVVKNNVVTEYEADYIIKKASKSFSESKIVSGLDTSIRKSETTWMYKSDPVVGPIIRRLCESLNVPLENAEPLQIVKYRPGGYYNEHHDSCCDPGCDSFIKDGGQRILTVLIYLNDSFEGGATKFPNLDTEIKAPLYGGIVFHPLAEDTNQCHPHALHAGMPIKSGTKYVCNLWIREGPYPRA